MVKYRRLKMDELEELESEFVRFLASNSVTAEDWISLKSQEPQKAEDLIDLFSDLVFDKILSTVEYMEHKLKSVIRVYRFQDEKITMVGMMVEDNPELDFTANDSPETMMIQLQQSGGNVKTFSGEKRYKFEKEKEIFLLMEEGALISKDPLLYNTIKSLQE